VLMTGDIGLICRPLEHPSKISGTKCRVKPVKPAGFRGRVHELAKTGIRTIKVGKHLYRVAQAIEKVHYKPRNP